MQFTRDEAELIESGAKTQHRVVQEPGDYLGERCGFPAVFDKHGKMKYVVTGRYAVQYGRKKLARKIEIIEIAHVPERVQGISHGDVMREGIKARHDGWSMRGEWALGWNSMHGRGPGKRWEDNPLVWVLTIRVVDDGR